MSLPQVARVRAVSVAGIGRTVGAEVGGVLAAVEDATLVLEPENEIELHFLLQNFKQVLSVVIENLSCQLSFLFSSL